VGVRGGLVVLVEPFGKGGGVDVIARLLADPFAAALGARVVVDNRPGLGSTAAPAFVASAPADGRTLLLNTSAHAYSAALSERLPYDPLADFVPVAAVTSQAYVLVVNRGTGVCSLVDLAHAGRERPGALSFVSAGVGTGTHVCAAQLNHDLGIDARHAPARPEDGIAETIARVVAGEAEYAVSPIPIAAPHIAAGALVALGVTAARRSLLLPRVPTLAEAGAKGFDFPIWYGLWAPAATAAPVVEELSAAVTRSLQSPELASRLKEHGAEILRLTRTEFEELVRSEAARARRLA
jgi:tripartite-type tricarboxylate transporter receptor subunit TctC